MFLNTVIFVKDIVNEYHTDISIQLNLLEIVISPILQYCLFSDFYFEMGVKLWCLCQILVLLKIVNVSIGVAFDFVLEDEDVYSHCTDYPDYYFIDHGMDFSNLKYELVERGLFLEGNITIVWDIQPTDRVEVTIKLFQELS